MDSQTVEIIGRNYLVSQLVSAGLEVARPERDRGVDLIAYVDLDEAGGGFVACTIQMKAATNASFGVDRKYEKFITLLFTHVWRAATPDRASVYSLTYPEAMGVANSMGMDRDRLLARGRHLQHYPPVRPSSRPPRALSDRSGRLEGQDRQVGST